MADTITEIPVIRGFPSVATPPKMRLYQNRLTPTFTAAGQEILFQHVLPDRYKGGNLRFKLFSTTDQLGAYTWELSFKRLSAGSIYTAAPYTATKILTSSTDTSLIILIDNITFTNTELGYSASALDELFLLKVKMNTLPSLAQHGLLNIIVENV